VETNKKVMFSEFKNDVAGCTEARQYLISIGKWSPDIERRDGWEIINIANKEIRKHNQQWQPYDDI
tara:strand:+ start:359 stop:556 length:198 start_codon:yes stop_codon:yes gene_type:complete